MTGAGRWGPRGNASQERASEVLDYINDSIAVSEEDELVLDSVRALSLSAVTRQER